MGTIKLLNKWANAHSYYPLDILRVALGVFLFIKGMHFLNNMQALRQLFEPIKNLPGGMIWLHLVLPAHFIGGMQSVDFLIATTTLLVCVFFLFYGSGKHSVDYYFKMQQ